MNFENRHQVEEYLAQQAEGGVIVELGGGYGNGAVAMVNGTRCGRNLPIYVIDPYEPYRDQLGGEYGPQTHQEFHANLESRGYGERVQHVEQDAWQAGARWDKPVALLWLDLSMPYEDLWAILSAWESHVVEGGVLGITGLEYSQLGTQALMEELIKRGWRRELDEQRFVAVLRKMTANRAIFYICSETDGMRYIREAACSARSVKRHLGLPCFLFLEGSSMPKNDIAAFDNVYTLPGQRGPFWYLDNARYFVQAAAKLLDYQQLLYLDVDTLVCCPCMDIFQPLDRFDMLFGLSAQRDAIESALGVPASFTTRQIGVNPFRNTPQVRAFLAHWLALYEEHWRVYDNNDEAPMRDALYSFDGIQVGLLPPEYCLRFDFGAWVVGMVRILHGRRGGVSIDREPLERVAEEINSTTRMRIWNHGLLR